MARGSTTPVYGSCGPTNSIVTQTSGDLKTSCAMKLCHYSPDFNLNITNNTLMCNYSSTASETFDFLKLCYQLQNMQVKNENKTTQHRLHTFQWNELNGTKITVRLFLSEHTKVCNCKGRANISAKTFVGEITQFGTQYNTSIQTIKSILASTML